jgi:hypothetical protein
MIIVLLVAALLVCVLTWTAGWWGVVVAALLVGAVWRDRRGVTWLTALAAVVGWSLLLLLDAAHGRFGVLATTLAGVMHVSAAALVVVTLLFAALLAWSAATIAVEICRIGTRDSR